MPKQKKQQLKKRADGRYAAYYHKKAFYGSTSDEALALRDAYIHLEKIHTGNTLKPTIESYSMKWFENNYKSSPISTQACIRTHLKYLNEKFGLYSISDIKPSDIKSIYAEYYSDKSNSYTRAAAGAYCSLFDAAIEDGYCTFNPARMKSASPGKHSDGTHRAITAQERQWILTYCHDHRAFPAVMVMLYAGLRPQEAKALNIERDCDFKKMEITIHQTAHIDTFNHYIRTNDGKTKNANRKIPIFPPLYNALKNQTGILIKDASGNPVSVTAWNSLWNSYVTCMETAINGCHKRWYGKTKEHQAILAAGGKLPKWIPFTIKPYDLRTSFCCFCRDNGVDLKTTCYWMGHSNAKMVLNVYDEVSYERRIKETKKMIDAINNSQNNSQPSI